MLLSFSALRLVIQLQKYVKLTMVRKHSGFMPPAQFLNIKVKKFPQTSLI